MNSIRSTCVIGTNSTELFRPAASRPIGLPLSRIWMLPELNGNGMPRTVTLGVPPPSSHACTPGTYGMASQTVRTPSARRRSPSRIVTMPGTKSLFMRVFVAMSVSCCNTASSSASSSSAARNAAGATQAHKMATIVTRRSAQK